MCHNKILFKVHIYGWGGVTFVLMLNSDTNTIEFGTLEDVINIVILKYPNFKLLLFCHSIA